MWVLVQCCCYFSVPNVQITFFIAGRQENLLLLTCKERKTVYLLRKHITKNYNIKFRITRWRKASQTSNGKKLIILPIAYNIILLIYSKQIQVRICTIFDPMVINSAYPYLNLLINTLTVTYSNRFCGCYYKTVESKLKNPSRRLVINIHQRFQY